MSDRERGRLIVSVSGMRTWAAGLGGSKREVGSIRADRRGPLMEQPFLGDLRLIEDPSLSRGDKLRVIDRIIRSWGVDGRTPR